MEGTPGRDQLWLQRPPKASQSMKRIHAGAPSSLGLRPTVNTLTCVVKPHPADCPADASRNSKLSNPRRRHAPSGVHTHNCPLPIGPPLLVLQINSTFCGLAANPGRHKYGSFADERLAQIARLACCGSSGGSLCRDDQRKSPGGGHFVVGGADLRLQLIPIRETVRSAEPIYPRSCGGKASTVWK